jgi:hypothetical protein
MNRSLIRCGVFALALGLGACELRVDNPNNPGTKQVKATPADLENFLGTQYRRWHAALYGTTGNVWGMANIQSFENFSTLANNCQNARYPVPATAPANNNAVGNTCGGEQNRIYFQASEVARSASDVLKALDGGLSFGSAGRDARGRAFAQFLRGLSLGYLALVYDSAAVISPTDPVSAQGTAIPAELSGYQDVMAAALDALDQSIAAATADGSGFPLDATWMFTSQPSSVTAAEFIKIVRSYAARFRANVARTPLERAAVDWDKVIADAQHGIDKDLLITTSSVTGPNNTWVGQWYAYTTWHQMTPFIIGMADTSGSYASWIATPLTDRGADSKFFMITPDQRFPQGATRDAQKADFSLAGTAGSATDVGCTNAAQTCKRYFVNRATSDPAASPSWGGSQYDHARFYSWRTSGSGGNGQNGPMVFMTVAEINLLEAEGHFRKGEFAEAAALIDKTRSTCGYGSVPAGCTLRATGNGTSLTWVPVGGGSSVTAPIGGGLPALSGVVTDAVTPVPGGNGCVPKVPSNASSAGGGTIACGNLWEALKYEKRIETAYTHFAAWFLDSRGWGDLAQTVPFHWAPPFEELQSRFRVGTQIYSTGGSNPTGGAGPSNYGW